MLAEAQIIYSFFSFSAFCDASEAWQLSTQDPATPIMEGMIFFHNHLVLLIILWFLMLWFWFVKSITSANNKKMLLFASFCMSALIYNIVTREEFFVYLYVIFLSYICKEAILRLLLILVKTEEIYSNEEKLTNKQEVRNKDFIDWKNIIISDPHIIRIVKSYDFYLTKEIDKIEKKFNTGEKDNLTALSEFSMLAFFLLSAILYFWFGFFEFQNVGFFLFLGLLGPISKKCSFLKELIIALGNNRAFNRMGQTRDYSTRGTRTNIGKIINNTYNHQHQEFNNIATNAYIKHSLITGLKLSFSLFTLGGVALGLHVSSNNGSLMNLFLSTNSTDFVDNVKNPQLHRFVSEEIQLSKKRIEEDIIRINTSRTVVHHYETTSTSNWIFGNVKKEIPLISDYNFLTKDGIIVQKEAGLKILAKEKFEGKEFSLILNHSEVIKNPLKKVN